MTHAAPSAPGTAPPGQSLVFRPASFFEPLRLEEIFGPNPSPLEVELGSGDGSFLAAYAAQHPDRHFLGIERLLGRLRKLNRKGLRLGLFHLRLLRVEAAYCLEYLLPSRSVSALHVYFPDPWPKRRHRKNRLINERFPELARRILQPAGFVHLRTDDPDYHLQMQRVFAAAPNFIPTPLPSDLEAIHTDFERDFHARGIPTRYASFQLRE